MARKRPVAAQVASRERPRLRAAVLHLGGVLGWQPRAVIRFSEALTGCPWPRCNDADLAAVLDEYQTLIQVIEMKETKAARRMASDDGLASPAEPARRGGAEGAGGFGGDRAPRD